MTLLDDLSGLKADVGELTADARRVLLRVQGGDDIVVGTAEGRDEGVRLARGVIRLIDEAEARGDWPELGGRFIRPGSIVSVDVQRID